MSASAERGEETPVAAGSERLWSAVDRMLDRMTLDGILAHHLGALAAERRRRLGLELPEALRRDERVTALGRSTAVLLLRRIRESCEGPLVLIKGPELARLYPQNSRPFGDLDLLAPDAEAVHRSLLKAGFTTEGDDVPERHHHLQPLVWPTLALRVEVHSHLNWPQGLAAPGANELLTASVPSSLGVDDVFAPGAVHHSLILAVHGWQHRPLRVLRDLIDVAAASAEADEADLDRAAAAWGIERIWHTTRSSVSALFYGGPRTLSLRSWARNLEQGRGRTVLEIDLEALISGFWWMPAHEAVGHAGSLIRQRVIPAAEETWRGKLGGAAAWMRAANTSRGKRDDSGRQLDR